MLARIGNALGCLVLNGLRGAAVPVRCAKCGFEFKPFEEHRFTRWREIIEPFPCPSCGHRFGIGEDARALGDESAFNPPGRQPPPRATRIERRAPTPDTLLFYLPPSGRGGVVFIMAIAWNLLTLPFNVLVFIFPHALEESPPLGAKLFIGFFGAIGLALIYSAARLKYSTHLLYLSPELVRVQRKLLFRATQDLAPGAITNVRLVEFYQENETPVHGVEIATKQRRIRFGSALTDGEKRWLAWEIRAYLRKHELAPELPPER